MARFQHRSLFRRRTVMRGRLCELCSADLHNLRPFSSCSPMVEATFANTNEASGTAEGNKTIVITFV